MSEIQDYASRVGDTGSLKLGTFSYLPQLNQSRLKEQVEYLVRQDWDPAVEHVEPERSSGNYWYLWKLPLFGERNVESVLAEIQSCQDANPGHHIRLVGYDKLKQTQGTALVVYRSE